MHLEVANSATMDYWIMEMLANVKRTYSNISNHKDFKTRGSLALLHGEYVRKFEQLSLQTGPNTRAARNIKSMRKWLEWFYNYHDRYLRQELLSRVSFAVNELYYFIKQKSIIIQKVLIILLVFVLIELFSKNSFITVTLTLVAGIFYLRL
jgi:hypothetical protein